jgi:aerobic carbon-monoxide dehydrogenase medium subunit
VQVPAPFEYERATSVEHALQLLTELGPEARILAGGYSLLPMMKLRLARPEWLIDIDDLVPELGYIRADDSQLQIGAMTRHRELLESELIADRAPIFVDAERVIADPVVRNRGTIGGALCQADPSEDLSAVCTALDAEIVIRSLDGVRIVDMGEFYRGPYQTAVEADEIVIEIRIPLRRHSGSAYEKVNRRVGDWAVAAAATSVTLTDGAISDAGIALVAVGGEVGSTAAREVLLGEAPSADLFERAGGAAAATCAPVSDQRGSAEYKRHLVGVLTTRALSRSAERAADSVASCR